MGGPPSHGICKKKAPANGAAGAELKESIKMIKTTSSASKEKDSTGSKPCTYKNPVLVRMLDKVSGELLGYLAEPEVTHQYGDLGYCKPWYQVTREDDGAFVWWRCTCKGSAVYGKRCKHIKAAMILCGELIEEPAVVVAEVEEKVVEPEVVVPGDMSVAGHLLEEELIRYERDLQEWGIDALRQNIKVNGLSVASRSKEPLIVALVAHRRATLRKPVPGSDTEMSPECPVDVHDTSEVTEQERAEDEWTEQEIVAIRRAAQPQKSAPLNGNRGFNVLLMRHVFPQYA